MTPGDLPGGDLVLRGLADLSHGIESEAALLVSIGAPRLTMLGYSLVDPIPDAEHRLYEMLRKAGPMAAHSKYNALIRRLVSFERAAACANR
jgi:hypothetical protein